MPCICSMFTQSCCACRLEDQWAFLTTLVHINPDSAGTTCMTMYVCFLLLCSASHLIVCSECKVLCRNSIKSCVWPVLQGVIRADWINHSNGELCNGISCSCCVHQGSVRTAATLLKTCKGSVKVLFCTNLHNFLSGKEVRNQIFCLQMGKLFHTQNFLLQVSNVRYLGSN